MTHNLNCAACDEFMQINMIKRMDDIIAYGNNDQAENSENETEKITQELVDDTIEGKEK